MDGYLIPDGSNFGPESSSKCTSGWSSPQVATRDYFDDCQVLVVDMGQNRVPEEIWFAGWRITPLSS